MEGFSADNLINNNNNNNKYLNIALNLICTRQVKPGTDILWHFTKMVNLAECCIEEIGLRMPPEIFDVCCTEGYSKWVAAIYEKPLSARVFFLLDSI